MQRRPPTKLELKEQEVQEEWENKKKEVGIQITSKSSLNALGKRTSSQMKK